MKQHIHINVLIAVIAVLGLAGCTKNFDAINTDPNGPVKIEPDFLFTGSVFNTLNIYGGPMNRVVFFNYTQHFSGFQGEFQRFNYSNSDNNLYWRQTYVNALQPVHRIVEEYQDDPTYHNRVVIAKIWKAYLFSNTLSIWGGIPMEGALLGEPNVPFTSEQEAYTLLLADLKTLAEQIDLDGDSFAPSADKIYGGNLLNWKKFATTLRLRLALRISNPAPNGNPELAEQVIAEIYDQRQFLIESEAETAKAKWGTTSDDWNPLYDRIVYNYEANIATIPVLGESLVYHTAPYHDPRLKIWAKPATQGPYTGQYVGQNIAYGGGNEFAANPQDNPHTGLKQVDYSAIGDVFSKADAYYTFLSHAEAALLKAEAALNGWWPEAADQLYYEGIDASMTQFGVSAEEAQQYKSVPGIAWGTAADTVGRESEFKDWLQICSSAISAGDYRKQIIMQHWLALPMQGVDAWALLRRTQLLEFQPQFATYDGNYKYMPQRLPYPSDEYNTNGSEVQKAVAALGGEDVLETKLWFALPTRKNPYLPY